MFLPLEVLDWALNVVVVRSGGRTILPFTLRKPI
jgi:hypothetical protein